MNHANSRQTVKRKNNKELALSAKRSESTHMQNTNQTETVKREPVITMRDFFNREDVQKLQAIQKNNPFDSVAHRFATSELSELIIKIGAANYI